MSRNTKATIHLNAIKSNYRLAQTLAPNSNNIAVIKANAYGHGMLEVAHALEELVPAFAVAIIDEAVLLRDSGITKPILLLQGVETAAEVEYALQNNLWLMLHRFDQVETLCSFEVPEKFKAWLKFDSGMHRLGLDEVSYLKSYQKLANKFKQNTESQIILCSHFSNASDSSTAEVQKQITLFKAVNQKLNSGCNHLISLPNSAAIMGFELSHSDWNRPGIMLYGISPFNQPHPNDEHLKPTMTLTSEVIGLREIEAGEGVGYTKQWVAEEKSLIATVGIGYADGYPFRAESGTPVWIAGQKAYLVGRVSMDMIGVNVSDCKNVKLGDTVELWGKNIDAATIAKKSNTIGYELFTSISNRVVREYDE